MRPGTPKEQMRLLKLDMGVGVIGGNLVAYAIILSTATTLFGHHKSIATAADAAQALAALLGPLAKYLFAFGLIGAGLVLTLLVMAAAAALKRPGYQLPTGRQAAQLARYRR